MSEMIQFGRRKGRKFIPYPKPINDGTVRCLFCGQIDEEDWHDSKLCPASEKWEPQSSIADVLDKAADLLTPEGAWGQCGLGKADGNLCALLAIRAAASPRSEVYWKARDFFAKQIGGSSGFDIWRWNDAPRRTQAQVVAKLHKAATLARETSHGEAGK